MTEKSSDGKYIINIGGLRITSEEEPYFIIGKKVMPDDQLKSLFINVSDDVKKHEEMRYTTNLTSIGFIFSKLTFRSSSLTNADLNDTMEKERVGVSQYASGRFITCFSHIKYESVAFWDLYGGKNKSEKILLVFKNFTNNFKDYIHTDYCLLDKDKKVFFHSNECMQTLKHNCELGQVSGLPQINTDYNIRNFVKSIDVFDIEYLPVDDEIFKQDYSGEINIDFRTENVKLSAEPQIFSKMKAFNPECLGIQKSNAWDYEKESRILCCLDRQDFNEWSFIDLRLKEDIFKDLKIIMSPWAKDSLESEIRAIIDSSPINDDIKTSIKIKHSDLEGKVNIE